MAHDLPLLARLESYWKRKTRERNLTMYYMAAHLFDLASFRRLPISLCDGVLSHSTIQVHRAAAVPCMAGG